MIANDPIFTLIERHRAATHALSAAVSNKDKVQEVHWPWSDAPERIAADAQHDAASDARQEALEELLTTEPTTIAGAAAVLDYVNEPSWGKEDDDKETILVEAWEVAQEEAFAFLPRLAAMLRRLAGDVSP
jgi:hypothetical protein